MIYLLGGAGYGNFGDELIVKEWLTRILEKPGRSVHVDGDRCGTFVDLFGTMFNDVTYTETFCQLRYNGPNSFWHSFVRGLNFFLNGGVTRYPKYSHLDKELDKVELLHLHGGGYLNKLWPHNGFLLGVAVALKRRTGCRLVGTGLGLGPLPECDEAVGAEFTRALNEFELFECRDIESFRLVRRYSDAPHLLFGFDDTYLSYAEPETRHSRTLHVSHFAAKGSDHISSMLIHARRVNAFENFLFWECSPSDAAQFETYRAILPEMKRLSLKELVRGRLPVSSADFMITGRFHPHLLAARRGATGLYLTNSSYYDVKHGSVVAIGSSFTNIRHADDSAFDRSNDAWIAAFDNEHVLMKRKIANFIYG